MSDLFVHVRLKECCRKALGEIDGVKKGIGGTGAYRVSLAKILGEKTVLDALTALATTIGKSAPEGDGKFTAVKKKTLTKAAATHAKQHKGKGETTEAHLWDSLAAVFEGKDLPKAAGVGGLAGAAGAAAGKAGAKLPGGTGTKIAGKAKEKLAEYKEKGVTYSQKAPFYPASNHADCSHFVHDVLKSSGLDVPYVTTHEIAKSPYFKPTADPQPGDVIWQPGHMGIYTGKNDKGQPMGAQMGKHGAAEAVWGEGGWFEGGGEVKYFTPGR